MTRSTLPVLDPRRFDAELDERRRFLAELREAARKYGFFYLAGHGISEGPDAKRGRPVAAILRAARDVQTRHRND